MTSTIPDPIRAAAKLVSPADYTPLERRIKQDVFASIARIKPDATKSVDFEQQVLKTDSSR